MGLAGSSSEVGPIQRAPSSTEAPETTTSAKAKLSSTSSTGKPASSAAVFHRLFQIWVRSPIVGNTAAGSGR